MSQRLAQKDGLLRRGFDERGAHVRAQDEARDDRQPAARPDIAHARPFAHITASHQRFEDVTRGKFCGHTGRDQMQARVPLRQVLIVCAESRAFLRAELHAVTRGMRLKRRVEFVDVSPDVMRGALIDVGLPVWQADGLIEDYTHYRRGEASAVTSGVRDGAGTAPRTFADFARDYASAFSA